MRSRCIARAATSMALLSMFVAAADLASARPAAACAPPEVTARRLAKAIVERRADVVVELTHPLVYKTEGERKAMLDQLRGAYASSSTHHGFVHDMGVRTLEAVQVGVPGAMFQDARVWAVFVPYSAVEVSAAGHTKVQAFYLGLSDDRCKSWRFIDGAAMNETNIRAFLPSYAGKPPLPARRRDPL